MTRGGWLLAVVVACTLAGCGQQGPLYLPERATAPPPASGAPADAAGDEDDDDDDDEDRDDDAGRAAP